MGEGASAYTIAMRWREEFILFLLPVACLFSLPLQVCTPTTSTLTVVTPLSVLARESLTATAREINQDIINFYSQYGCGGRVGGREGASESQWGGGGGIRQGKGNNRNITI